MNSSTQISETEMWLELARLEGKSVDLLKASYPHITPEDVEELKAHVLSERRSDVVEETIDCYTLGVHLARIVADALSEACSRDKSGRLVYRKTWSDERVVDALSEEMADIVERMRQGFKGSPLIDSNGLVRLPDDFRLPALS